MCVVCACVNPSGNDSEMAGPVGIVQQRHFQVSVLALLLQHTLSRCRTQNQHRRQAQLRCGNVRSNETCSACYCFIPFYLGRMTVNSQKYSHSNKRHPYDETRQMNESFYSSVQFSYQQEEKNQHMPQTSAVLQHFEAQARSLFFTVKILESI